MTKRSKFVHNSSLSAAEGRGEASSAIGTGLRKVIGSQTGVQQFSFIGGGYYNQLAGHFSAIHGGACNSISNHYSYAGIFGCRLNAKADLTFHTNCLYTYDTPFGSGGPFPAGTILRQPFGTGAPTWALPTTQVLWIA